MTEQMVSSVAALFTMSGVLALLNVILIDIVLSGDNAIVIGMATKDLKGKERKRAIVIGIVLATVLRIVFASTVVYLLRVVGIKFAGGLLLLYVVWKFYRELRLEGAGGEGAGGGDAAGVRTLKSAVWLILMADVSMSLDNVLAVSGASRENILVLGIGLVFSILLMAIASNYIAARLEKYPQIQWAGLLVILFVAIEMMLSGTHELEEKVFHVNVLPFVMFLLALGGFTLHARYIKPAAEDRLAAWFASNWRSLVILNQIVLLALIFFGGVIHDFLVSHRALLYFACALILFVIIEVVATIRHTRVRKNAVLQP
jgi:YjbE family integral membrane protein